jgi:cell division septal protein FtsQ
MKKQKKTIPLKPIGAAAIAVLLFVLLLIYLGQAAKKWDYFRIRSVVFSRSTALDLSYLKGKNLFELDMKKEARYIAGLYPGCKNVRLIRVLPNRLFVEFITRQPIASIKLYRYFCVDEDTFLFEPLSQGQEQDLPVITGLETKIFGPRVGMKCNSRELSIALGIIKQAKKNKVLRYFRIKRIEMIDPGNISLFLVVPVKNQPPLNQDLLEIKIGREVKENLSILGSLLVHLHKDWHNLKYIDLRFKEPVIKFNDKNNVK